MKHLFLFLISLFLLTHFPKNIVAQTQPSATPALGSTVEYVPKVVCLKSERCDKTTCTRKENPSHTAKLAFEKEESKRPPLSTDFVIMECLKTDNPEKGEICTVGDSTEQYWSYLSGDPYKYAFQGLFSNTGTVLIPAGDTSALFKTNVPRFQRTAQDKFMFGLSPSDWLEWQSYTAKGVDRRYKALFRIPMTKQAVLDALKQKTIDEYAVGQDCVWINWDPDGRVFDSVSLEPVPDVSVQILEKKADGTFVPVVNFLDPLARNPMLTDNAGKFSFFVEGNNDYQLVIIPPEGYEFSLTNPIKPHANATKIYKNIYPINTGVNIYEAKGKKETRDIPIRPKLGVGREYPLTGGYTVERLGKSYVVNLTYSHPFTKIVPFSVSRSTGKETMLTALASYANASGSGQVNIRFSQLPQGDDLGGVYAEKVVLTGDLPMAHVGSKKPFSLQALFSKVINFFNVSAQSTKSLRMTIDPIPSYLEGIAYDSTGKAIPNAKIVVNLINLNVPYYETSADSSGLFKISSEYLPTSPYTVSYYIPSTGEVVETPISTFLSQNNEYISKKKINVYVIHDKTGSVVPTSSGGIQQKPVVGGGLVADKENSSTQGGGIFSQQKMGNNLQNNTPLSQSNTSTQSTFQLGLLLIVVILVLLGLGVAGIGVWYWTHKNTPPV